MLTIKKILKNPTKKRVKRLIGARVMFLSGNDHNSPGVVSAVHSSSTWNEAGGCRNWTVSLTPEKSNAVIGQFPLDKITEILEMQE